MYPDAIFWDVHLYGVMIALGILGCFLTFSIYVKKKNVDEKLADFVFYNAIISIITGFLSATLFQSVYNYLENPEDGFEFGGMTFIGGLIGGVSIFLIIYFATKNNIRKKYKGTLIDIMPIAPACITIAHGFGRIGCFFAGCCYGKETDSFLGVKFPDLPNPVYPTQLFEAIFLFLFFAVLCLLAFKKNTKGNLNMSIYLIGYGIWRFCIEFLRGDDRGKLFNILSPSQFWSIIMVIIGLCLLFVVPILQKRLKEKKATLLECAEGQQEGQTEGQQGQTEEK